MDGGAATTGALIGLLYQLGAAPEPSYIDAIARLGALGFAIIAIWGLVTGRVRREGEVKEINATWSERFAELKADRDDWKAIATSSSSKLDTLTDAVVLLGQKLGNGKGT